MGDSIENIEPLNRLEKIRLSPPPSRADGMWQNEFKSLRQCNRLPTKLTPALEADLCEGRSWDGSNRQDHNLYLLRRHFLPFSLTNDGVSSTTCNTTMQISRFCGTLIPHATNHTNIKLIFFPIYSSSEMYRHQHFSHLYE
jgi:hypothetical protein